MISNNCKRFLRFRQNGNKRFAQVLALREELETKLEAWRKQVSGVLREVFNPSKHNGTAEDLNFSFRTQT